MRRILGLCLLSLVVGALTVGDIQAHAFPIERPNVLFVMTDDMPESMLGPNTMPEAQARLVERGVTFENAYVTDSLCCPSRATILRGQYAHNHGVVTNIEEAGGGDAGFHRRGLEESTAATWLDEAGYNTAFVGKYLNGYDGVRIPPGWDEWYGQYGNNLNENGASVAYPKSVMAEVQQRKAFDVLGRATDSPDDPPFALFLWVSSPHLPGYHHSRYDDLFIDERLPRPPSFNEADVSDKPRWVRNLPRIDADARDKLRVGYRNQLRSLRGVDDGVAQLMDLLEQRGELGNTYVVFTSDNGQHTGEHRWIKASGAKNTPYEEAASVPLAVRGPGVPEGVTREQLVASNDLAPTFAEIAGARPSSPVDGRSLLPILGAQPEAEWRTALLNERLEGPRMTLPVPRYGAVVTEDRTYVEWGTGERELYDLNTDPYQLSNLAGQRSNEEPALSARLRALRECAGSSCREAEAP